MEKSLVEIKKINKQMLTTEKDVVICETPITIYINGEEFVTLLCTSNHLKELAYGFLFSEGFINHREDVENFSINMKKGSIHVTLIKSVKLTKKMHGRRVRTTGCGKGTIFYHTIDSLKSKKISTTLKIDYKRILNMSKELNKISELFLETGGVHTTILGNSTGVITYYEDVGRHNTVDKIIGYSLLNEIELDDKLLFTSGRISSEMLLKTLKGKIPMIISRSAPTELAIKLAREYNVSLIGFVRGQRMNIYHGHERVNID